MSMGEDSECSSSELVEISQYLDSFKNKTKMVLACAVLGGVGLFLVSKIENKKDLEFKMEKLELKETVKELKEELEKKVKELKEELKETVKELKEELEKKVTKLEKELKKEVEPTQLAEMEI